VALEFLLNGYMVTPSTWIQPHYQQVKVEGGIVPCVSGPLSITVTNIGHQRVVLPKHAVITEIYPFDARFVQEEVNTNKTTTYEIPQFQNIQLKQNRKYIALTKAVKDLHIKPKKETPNIHETTAEAYVTCFHDRPSLT